MMTITNTRKHYAPTHFAYEVLLPDGSDDCPLPILVNRSDTSFGGDLSQGRRMKLDGVRFIHVGDYNPRDYDQHRAILDCLAGLC